MSLTILHVLVPEPPGELGGADMHVLDLAVSQRAAGLRPVVIERGSEEFAARAGDLGLEVVSVTGAGFGTAVRRLGATIADVKADVVHAHGYDADYWAAAAKLSFPRLFRTRPLVFTQHGIVEDSLWHKAKTYLDVACTRLADGVVVCAEGLLPRIRRWCPNGHVAYIPNGVSAPRLMDRSAARAELAERFGVPASAVLVGYVGRLSPEKRPDRVLDLVAAARREDPRIHGILAGSGGLADSLRERAVELGIAEAVTFTGLLPDVGPVYAALDAFALLSDTETTSRVVIEAMTSGVPVLASAVGGLPDLLDAGRVGELVPVGDGPAAVRALRAVLADPERYRASAKARAAQLFHTDAMRAEVGRFYDRLLQDRSRSRAIVSSAEDR
ncbi:glycosyltransferase family 4 protein [Nocardia iowensis]|uniref:Glycosyltransferase family 4 protein n=1 Tax=Nocardia iowensis TaxID=204891 RepID=A0ABX8RQN6_NOCIO|nr:glycosyltransferase family 4 protein [Nocardia iowensis]QXN90735.1 glycosyltransferase family 4 protein [Nocardia iowensis]